MAYFPKWPGPHKSLEVALMRASQQANKQGRPIAIWWVGSEKDGGWMLQHASQPKPADAREPPLPRVVAPDTERIGFARWEVVAKGGFTDRTLRDVWVKSWRDIASSARRGPHAREYAVNIGEKTVSLYGSRTTLYTFIVRRNPHFTPTPLPTSLSTT